MELFDGIRWTTRGLISGSCRPTVIGLENVPKEGPFIVAPNHLSFLDSVIVQALMPRPVAFFAKAEYFTTKGIKGRFMKSFFEAVGSIPVERGEQAASVQALKTLLDILEDGRGIGIYPEGTRSPDGRLYKGKTGVARMALEARVPVIPVAMIGTERVMPIGTRLPKVRRIGIIIGKPIDFTRFDGLEGDRFVLRSVTDELVYELRALSGQEYVDLYASSVREQRATQSR